MNIRIATTLSNRGHRVAAMALAGSAALSAACASGGGAPPPAGVEAEEILAGLTGAWALDETTGTLPEFELRKVGPPVRLDVTDLGQFLQLAQRMGEEDPQRVVEDWRPILEVWVDRPKTLILRVDEDRVSYMPAPGQIVEIPMSGEWVRPDPQRQSVRARASWEGTGVAIQRQVGSRGQVRSVLEIVDGRLRISRRLVPRGFPSTPPYVLMYDRDTGGRVSREGS